MALNIKGFFSKEKMLLEPVRRQDRRRKPVANSAKNAKGYSCEQCGLSQADIISPRMEPHGLGRKKILLWGEAPGNEEDKAGEQFCERGASAGLLKNTLLEWGVEMDVDCWKVNAIDCHIPGNKKPTLVQLKCCYARKLRVLEELRPQVILLLGDYAIDSFYGCSPERSWLDLGIASLRGKAIPDMALGAWVCHSYHPAYILRGNEDKSHVFEQDVGMVARFRKRPDIKNDLKYKILLDLDEVLSLIKEFGKESVLVHDYETSSYRYYEKIHKVYTIGLQELYSDTVYVIPLEKTNVETGEPYWSYSDLQRIKLAFKDLMLRPGVLKVAQHLTHEHKCSKFFLGADTIGWWWDTKLGNRVGDEAHGVNGLKQMAYMRFGQGNYGLPDSVMEADPKQMNKLDLEPLEKVAEYNARDVGNTTRLCKLQRKEVEAASLGSAYELLHRGAESFAYMEQEGIRLDMPLLGKFRREWSEEYESLKESVLLSREARRFKKLKGRPIQYNKQIGRADLATLLVEIMKLPPSKVMDEAYLSGVKDKSDFLQYELKARKVLKRLSVLENWDSLQVDGFLYPSFNLDVARSYRSSSSEPNFQNVPKRDEEGALVRQLIIPRVGHVLLEVDYSGMEVRILACWSLDPVLIDFVLNGYDMHGHWAAEIYGVNDKEVGKALWKALRYGAKNGFVFPNFYGSYWKNTAPALWDHMSDDMKREWTGRKENGIPESWTRHVKDCDYRFWDMFKGVRRKQEEAVEQYKKLGYLQMIGWGFRRHGYMNRNTIFNTHIQGPAYHCLMDDINHLVPLKIEEQWESKMPGQIHDAIFMDVKREEKEHVIEAVTEEMTVNILRRHKWIIVPLEVEWEQGEKNWLEMEKVV